MKNKMIKCKTCGGEIAKSAKVCPKCGAKQHQGVYIACGVIMAIAIFLCFIVIFGSSFDENGSVNSGSSSSAVKNEKVIGIDGTLKGDCFDISIVDAKWTDELKTSLGVVTPENDGNKLLCLIFSAKNTTDSTKNVANAGFNAYVDGKKILPNVVVGSIDDSMVFVGAVSSEMEIVGFSVWELPEDWSEFRTSYIDSNTAVESKQYFVIHPEDIQ